MHGTIFLLSEAETAPDKAIIDKCTAEASRYFGDIFDYIDDMVVRDPAEECGRFLDEIKEYAKVDGKRIAFSIRDLYRHDFKVLGYPERKGKLFVDYFMFLYWLRENRNYLDPVILFDTHGTLALGYSLLDAALQPYYDDILLGRFPDAEKAYSYYLSGVLDYHI